MSMGKIISFIGGENCYSITKNYFEQTVKTYSLIYHNFLLKPALLFLDNNILRLFNYSCRLCNVWNKKRAKSAETIIASPNISFWFYSDYDRSDDAPTSKNPMAAAGAVKDALATGGVDKVFTGYQKLWVCLA